MTVLEFTDLYSEGELLKAAKKYLSALGDIKVILLNGELGAGKTALACRILEAAGARDIITSPTFTVCSTYEISPNNRQSGEPPFALHADLYRIRSFSELEQTGFFELLDRAELAVIEWGGAIKDFLARYAEINILVSGEERRYTFRKFN
ncbi:MAG: tRNA (adenosine(37)-N6)-threonylcarbamoyltransferase complex ATPase subunit type 1 TsaE [Deferribacteraceae bacterium]|jgi:tRNA threonylcarbamoyladenosine biosynthesis protein TsaE|nr:tRNA (adenosine(37)-N6)-threonylcarbamoyltransferase complex ATPase subunit type 1 TsaE [Deferribacteraceae bacterium]